MVDGVSFRQGLVPLEHRDVVAGVSGPCLFLLPANVDLVAGLGVSLFSLGQRLRDIRLSTWERMCTMMASIAVFFSLKILESSRML